MTELMRVIPPLFQAEKPRGLGITSRADLG